MRIWLVTFFEPLPEWDGNVRLLRYRRLANALLDRGHEVVLWTSDFNHSQKLTRGAPESLRAADGLEIRLLHGRPYKSNVSVARIYHNRDVASAFRREARLNDAPDVLVALYPTIELSGAAVDFARRRAVPSIVDIQDLWPDQHLTLLPPVARPVGRVLLHASYRRAGQVLRRASALTAVSRTYLRWGQRMAGGARPTDAVFPLGAEATDGVQDGSPPLPAGAPLPGDGIIIAYVGQFGSSYDLLTVVRAARVLFERRGLEVRFVFVGDGDTGAALRQEASGLLNVTFLGWQSPSAITAVLAAADVGIAPYRSSAIQSLPFKPFEYMAAGLPILSSLRGELEELIESEGIGRQYVAGSPHSLVAAVEHLATDPAARQRMAEAARALFQSTFNQRAVYEGFARFVEATATRRPNSG